MSSAPRTRTKPCDQCREKSNAISFVDETNSASRHSRSTAAESPSENGSQSESLDFAASVLQTLSKGNTQIGVEHEPSVTGGLSEEPSDDFGGSHGHEGFPASQDLSQLSLNSSPSGQATVAPHQYGTASLPVLSTQWQHSSPKDDTGKYVNHGGNDEQSPFGGYNSQLYQTDTLPSMMDLELHNPTSLLSANSSQPLSLEEACLLRCFVEKLARAFDTTDRDHHYISVLPLRAVHSPLLLNAICTASARFLTRVSSLQDPDSIIEYAGVRLPDLNMESAIHYHNKCISHLMGVSADPINSCSDDALAAITILRYHEQVDTHFTGTDNETFSIAVRAVFQASQNDADGLLHLILQPPRGSDVYATSLSSLRFSACLIALRQEIWSVLMHRRPFRLPILPVENYGTLDDTLAADDYDWTNRVLIWCAHVLKFCYPDDADEQPIDNRTRSQQWEAIKDFQRNWDEKRPPHFAPLYYRERNSSEGRYFPEYWITSPCQMLALQHIELARIVLAVHDTKIQLGIGGRAAHNALEELMREATRRVCGLAMSQKWCQEGMVTAAVGLSMCGEYFQDPGEQAAIMELVTLLERDHAWPTNTFTKSQSSFKMALKAVTLPKSLSDLNQWDKLVDQYKEFRLLSLQLSPESFSSNYAREAAFTKDIWEARLSNPLASSIIIVSDPEPGSVDDLSLILNQPWLASLVLYGPLEAKTAAKTWEDLQKFEPGSTYFGPIADEIESAYVLNAIYVPLSQRRKGLANKLIEYAKELAVRRNEGKKIMLVLLVNFNSVAAMKCYEKSGFEVVHDYWFDDPNASGTSRGHAAVMRLDVGA
ncbi:major facilitator superfamily transporter [Fusarium pseudocircinatum]|uniref:Major facilitator superfamily transporter n=1 Tax=Fusarium pseudocircinatum TaxID=56676 RepID=A0A8H5NTZ7_9HYPO|nr:major facilitator superfamily transporter [Fusarium pseudocircinatum]